MQRLPILFFVTTLKYKQTAKDYRHLMKAFNMKNIDFLKGEKSQLEEDLQREINFSKLFIYSAR